MSQQLRISLGQHTDKGRKEANQDFHGALIPAEPQLTAKGIALALADGISSSDVSHIASQTSVQSFLDDYFCTSDAWSVKKAAHQVLMAINGWLFSQTQQSQYRYDKDRGYVCTLSAMVLKSTTGHIFHVGDSRIYRVVGDSLEQLTDDHRVWLSREQSHLSRALGVNSHIEFDYRTVSLERDDFFVCATDGVYEFASPIEIVACIRDHAENLDAAARAIVQRAYENGSGDNLTIQLVRIDALPDPIAHERTRQASELPLPPLLEPRMQFDGFTVVRELHASSRSHVYLAVDDATQERVVIKIPSIDLRGDPVYLERFMMEDWIARRINSPHVLRPSSLQRRRNYLYVVTEFIDGQTLAQWMIDHPKPSLDSVRDIVAQIAKGLQAFHRMEMLHQDLRPANVMLDRSGTAKIIDFGSTRVAGVAEQSPVAKQLQILGTVQYTAPEYFLGEGGTPRSDLFSLGVIAYQMLAGKLPYGTKVAHTRTETDLKRLSYDSVLDERKGIPAWIDDVLKKAVAAKTSKRYEELSEFVYDLHHPNQSYLNRTRPPLIERNPIAFWKGVSLILAILVVVLLAKLHL